MGHVRRHIGLKLLLAWAVMLTIGITPPSRAVAQDSKPEIGFGVALTGPGGLYRYAPNRWGVMHVNFVNRQETPLELLSATYFDDQPTLQFGRKIWLPPRSKMQSWHPVKIPNIGQNDGNIARFHSLVMNAEVPGEVLIRTESGQMQHEGFLALSHEMITGVIDDLSGVDSPRRGESLELIGTCRLKQSLSRKIATLMDALYIPADENLQALDQLVVCDARPVRDAAGIASIRRWLHDGGHLWVMLDQVEPEFLDMLLGDEFECEIVDRVSLNTVRLEAGPAGPKGSDSEAFHEQPVELVRTVVANADLWYTVNGWPAAFWKTCGKGELLVTTLGPRGWYMRRPPKPPSESRAPGRRQRDQATPATPGSQASTPPLNPGVFLERDSSPFIPNDPMSFMCMKFWGKRPVAPLAPAEVEPIVRQYVGYTIPSRWLIVGLLTSFSLLLAITGACLWKIGRLEWLGGIGPVLAVGVSLILIGVGRQQRHAVPPTTASVQFIQVVEGTDDYLAQGQMETFTPEPGAATLGGHAGGWVMPDMQGLDGTTRRMVWTDLDRWQWNHLPSNAGTRSSSFAVSNALSERITATAMFGPEGLTGQLQMGSGHQPEDVMIATNSGRVGVNLNQDRTFTARTADVFSREQFLSADLLSDEQNRRRQLLEQLLTNPARRDYPDQPTVYCWTEAWDLGFETAADSRALGTALVAVPLVLQRPPAGTEVSVAAPLLPFRAIVGPGGEKPTGVWDQLRREFAEKSSPASVWLRYQIPPVLLPVRAKGGRVVVSVLGPIARLEIAGLRRGQVVPLKTWIDPVGTVEFQIADGESLTQDASGGIMLRISGGDPNRPELTQSKIGEVEKLNYWRIESLTFDLKLETIE